MELKNNALFKETCFIGGKWIESDSKEKIKVDNPANGEIIGELVDMMSLPANDAYVIERGKKEVLIPVIPEIVRSVDVKMGLVTITPMDGLLD